MYSTKAATVFSGLKITAASMSHDLVLVTATGYGKTMLQRIPLAETITKQDAAANHAATTLAVVAAAVAVATFTAGCTSGAPIW